AAYGPTRYDRTGMNCSFCAYAAPAGAMMAMPISADLMAFMVPSSIKRGSYPFSRDSYGRGYAPIAYSLYVIADGRADLSTARQSLAQCGNGHNRSFSFPICQSLARPCG